jgi:DNA-binding NarL/FixJ family response regulator
VTEDHDELAIRVGIVDDHPPIRTALAAAFAEAGDLRVVGLADDIDGALDLAGRVDVLVCDIQLDGHAEGLRILERIHDPRSVAAGAPAVLILSGYEQPSLVRAAIDRGAAGYLDKRSDLADIVEAVRALAHGRTAFTLTALRDARDARRRPSDRELQVIALVVAGSTNAEIGATLGRSEKTVESHLRRLFDRYGLVSRTELAVLAIDEGWTSPTRADG